MIQIYSFHCLFELSLFAIQQNYDLLVFKERYTEFCFGKIWYHFDSIRNACIVSCMKFVRRELTFENVFDLYDLFEKRCIYSRGFISNCCNRIRGHIPYYKNCFITFDFPSQYFISLSSIVICEECVLTFLSNVLIFKMNSTVGICCLDKEND